LGSEAFGASQLSRVDARQRLCSTSSTSSDLQLETESAFASEVKESLSETGTETGESLDAAAAEGNGNNKTQKELSKIFVTNLPYSCTESELSDFFRKQGEVINCRIHFRMVDGVRHSRGFASVEFADALAAARAIENLDSVIFGGRQIKVRMDNVSKLNREVEAKLNVDKKVFVDFLNPSLIWQDVKDHFQQTGNVQFVHMLWDRSRLHRQAVVEFGSAEEAQDAIDELNHSILQETAMKVRAYEQSDMLEKEPTGKSVFVNYIDSNMQVEDLQDHILQVVESIEKSKLFLHKSGDYKQAVVTLTNSADAKRVIEKLNRSFLSDRMIRVRAYIDNGGEFREGGRGVRGGLSKLFLDNLNSRVEWQEVKDHLRVAGNIIHVRVMWAESGSCKQAIAEVETEEDAENIVKQLNNSKLFGDEIFIRKYGQQEHHPRAREGEEQHVFNWGLET